MGIGIKIADIKDAKLREIATNTDKNGDKKLSGDEYAVFAQKAMANGATYEQVSNALEMNAFERWYFDVDKVSTDGKDDGKLSAGEIAESSAKGFFGGILKGMVKNPITTAVTIGLGAAATIATGGAALPVIVGLGAAASAVTIGTSAYKYAKADNDYEAKMALEGMGTGTAGFALAALGVKSANKAAANAGVKSLQGLDKASWGENAAAMFKSIPEALKVSKNQIMSKYYGLTYTSYAQGGAKIYKENIERINKTSESAINEIVNNANSERRPLTESEIAKVNNIRSSQQQIIQDIHEVAKNYSSNTEIEFTGYPDSNCGRSTGLRILDDKYTGGYWKNISKPRGNFQYRNNVQGDVFESWLNGVEKLKADRFAGIREDMWYRLYDNSTDARLCVTSDGEIIAPRVEARKNFITEFCEILGKNKENYLKRFDDALSRTASEQKIIAENNKIINN